MKDSGHTVARTEGRTAGRPAATEPRQHHAEGGGLVPDAFRDSGTGEVRGHRVQGGREGEREGETAGFTLQSPSDESLFLYFC